LICFIGELNELSGKGKKMRMDGREYFWIGRWLAA
jgi:hypothetical protein